MTTNLQSKLNRVVVTGARGALGKSVVAQFLAAGCEVVGFDRAGHAQVTPDPDVRGLSWISADLANAQHVKHAFDALKNDGGVDAVIHCAGGFRYASTDSISDEDIDFLLDSNLKSSILVARESMKIMRDVNFGRLVFVSSNTARMPGAGVGVYAASKAGIHALMESLTAENRASGINVYAVLPGIIDTAANRHDMPDADFNTWVKTDAIAGVIFALTQPSFDPVRSALIPVT